MELTRKRSRLTHKELLAKIDEPEHWFKPFLDIRQALRAVVELHKPAPYKMTGSSREIPGLLCLECNLYVEPKNWINYPCPTIQAIEKALQ